MNYQNLFQEENQAVSERYQLSMERIGEILKEETVADPFLSYFKKVAFFIGQIEALVASVGKEEFRQETLETLQQKNRALYEDVFPENYENSYGNPAYAVKMLGDHFGQLLSFLYAQIRCSIVYAYEYRLTDITVLNETFIEIYNMFEEGTPEAEAVRDVIYWFVSDYSDITMTYRVREMLDPSLSFARDIVMESDLFDLRYLFSYGEYISEKELQVASYLNSLPEETLQKMADTYTEGYIRGFEITGRDLSRKKSVLLRYEVGFEQMIKKAVENFKKAGLESILCRAATHCINRNPNRKAGYYSSSPNRQYDYDHRYDSALYEDKALKDRKLSVLKVAYETYKKEASLYAGPAVVETFGDHSFQPVNKEEAPAFSEKQEKLSLQYANESTMLINEYMPGDETSFTIIAFPVPQIGPDFPEIFAETIKINTLDYELYKNMQQIIIDTLDEAEYAVIKGRGGNETDLTVHLHPLKNRDKETNFENCVADVNIPLGEVFTSPMLPGTHGRLHVSSVFIGDFQFKELKMWFEDGMITGYTCSNFPDEREGKKLIKQVIMKNHDSLPMGEFAIGTNTTAYAMAKKFGIIDKLPILIVEKMGPHFAVGDTCYHQSEDMKVYNPDGKVIIARDNEISILRKEDPSKAYFSCHTDITIPYDELASIEAVKSDGEKVTILSEGKFALKGIEELNKPLT